MIGTVLVKPVEPEEFEEAMAWVCDPENNATLAEYRDRYEIIERSAPPDPLVIRKSEKLEELRTTWLDAEATGTVTVDGITIDATSRSNRDIDGLIVSMEAQGIENTVFCAADNSFHEVTLQQLKDFRLAVIGFGQRLYARKWELRTAIEAAETLEELDGIIISFAELREAKP